MTLTWPFDELTIVGPELVLRPVRDADIAPLVEVFPDDFDLDPSFPPLPGVPTAADRRRRLIQSIWRHRGCWSVDDWALDFGVWRDGSPLGIQTLEGTRFPEKHTVDSASWIAKPFRGRGFGVQARAAVLTLAFEKLSARQAITSAVVTNHASLGVSPRLGYRDNGVRPHDTGDGIVELQHLVLERDDHAANATRNAFAISGFDACRAFFGLD